LGLRKGGKACRESKLLSLALPEGLRRMAGSTHLVGRAEVCLVGLLNCAVPQITNATCCHGCMPGRLR
jgi:hypothetical protein